MITAIIWSKNRACQLHLLIESIRENIPHVFDIKVVYKATSPEFQSGYNKVVNSFVNDSLFHESEKFNMERLTRQILEEANDKVAFFTDDTVIFKKSPLIGQDFMDKVKIDNAVFSLRLGLNTIVQNCHTGELQYPLNQFHNEGDTISWDFSRYHPHMNYGYPFGLDGHIFDTSIVKYIIKHFRFKNTNELESNLFHWKHRIPQTMRSFKHSIAVNIPINGMSGVTRHGEKHPCSIEELNALYLDDYIIDLNEIMKHEIYGCHQEIPLTFIKRGRPKPPKNLKVEICQ